jgi:hypothetical protein
VTREAALVSLAHLTAYPHSAATLRAEGLLPALLAILAALADEQRETETCGGAALGHASGALRNFLAADPAEHIADFLALSASPAPVALLIDLLALVTSSSPTDAAAGGDGTPANEESREAAAAVEVALAECLDRVCAHGAGRAAVLDLPEAQQLPRVLVALLGSRETGAQSSALSAAEYLSREAPFRFAFHSSPGTTRALPHVH